MKENIETKKGNNLENLIGILLIMPIYMLILVVLNLRGDNRILFPTLMYLPIIIGIVLSYKIYKNKTSILIGVCILIFLGIAIYFFYNTYFVENTGWDGLGYFFLWLINTAILKIFACIFYGKIVGWKKGNNFLWYLCISSALLGFWR